ncbi:ribosomal protein L22e [Thelephora ganbajun]|uniref:Ribosomal protein L22e n=1 Tax=Thelephora ganbajun TaxID=370292 RepID=A0ACB6ZY70_THEGA|nr:ribosomal protein L22e [Thelephora ganbajun]
MFVSTVYLPTVINERCLTFPPLPLPRRHLKMPKATKIPAVKHKFVVDYSRPAGDGVFDGTAFEKFLHDRIKVDNKTGNLGENVKILREGDKHITITANIALSKRYLKYLTKKFLKKNALRDWIRVVATSKDVYQLRFYNIAADEEDEE